MISREDQRIFSYGTLFSLMLTAFLILMVNFYWSRRNLIRLASRIPGPKGYPIIGIAHKFWNASNYESFKVIVNNCENYPGIFRLWLAHKLVVGITDPEYLEYVVNNVLAKDPFYDFTKNYMGLGLFSAPVHIWKKNRRIINPTFNQKILNTFQPIFNNEAKVFLNNLLNFVGMKDIDVMKLCSSISVNALCETAMGVSAADQKARDHFGECIDKAMEVSMKKITNLRYYIDFFFQFTKDAHDFKSVVQDMKDFTENVVQEKRRIFNEEVNNGLKSGQVKGESKFKSFLDHLLHLSLEGVNLTDREIQDEVNTLMAAGSDTTAFTLCFSFVTLGIQQDVQQKVYEEVMQVIGKEGDVGLEDLPHLQYTERFIKETLRLFPIAAIFARSSPVDIKLGSYDVPANCTLLLVPFHIHRNPKYWKDPMKFDTDRFLPEENAKRNPYTFIPFSGGPRGCIGMKYAYMMLKTVIAHTVRKYKIHSEYKSIEEVKLKVNLMLRAEDGYKVSLELRQ